MAGAIDGMPQATLAQMGEAAGGTLDTGRLVVAIGPMVQNGSFIVNTNDVHIALAVLRALLHGTPVVRRRAEQRQALHLSVFIVDRIVE